MHRFFIKRIKIIKLEQYCISHYVVHNFTVRLQHFTVKTILLKKITKLYIYFLSIIILNLITHCYNKCLFYSEIFLFEWPWYKADLGDPDEVGAEVGVEGIKDGEVELGVGEEDGESKQYGAFDAVKPVSIVMSPL